MFEECLASTTPIPSTLDPTGSGIPTVVVAEDDRFVGRSEELALLRATLDAARSGIGGLVLVSGEPGIGKTRLALEGSFEARARGFNVVWGRCWEAGGAPPYWPWIEVLRQVLASVDRPSNETLGRHASQLARIVPEAFPHADAASPPADPESARFLLFDAVATLLRLAAASRRLVVVVDDLHAADYASMLLLVFLARALKDCSVVLVGTYRDAEARSRPDLVDPLGELARCASRVELRGLGPADICSMLQRSDGSLPSDGFVERIHRATDGNPFFVREIARLLRDEDASQTAAAFRVPDGIRDTVRRRLHPLPDSTRSLLATAAVSGREFDAVVLARAADIDMVTLLDHLAPAIAQGTIDVATGEDYRYSFRHALIRETIYNDLPPAERIQLHRAVRDALEAVSPTAPDRYVAELAHQALAAAAAGDDERFVDHAIHAARTAMQRMAFEEAVQLYQRTIDALVHTRPDERRRCELLLALGEAKEWSSDTRGSRAVIEQAADIARRLGAPDLLARAALAVGGVEALKATAVARCETATSLLLEALTRIGPRDVGLRARLRSRLALHYLTNGAPSDALAASAVATTDARDSSDKTVLAHTLISRHSAIYGPDHLEERWRITTELCDLAWQLNSREFAMRAQALRVVNALERGDLSTVDEAMNLHERLVAETQDPFERWVSRSWRAARALFIGRFDDATRLSHEAFELTRTVPGLHALEINGPAGNLGQLILIEDTRYGPPPDANSISAPSTRFGDTLVWRMAKLHVLTRLGREVETQAELEVMTNEVLSRARWGTWLAAMSFLTEAIHLVRDRQRAAEIYPHLLPYASHNITVSFVACRGSASRFLGLLAATLGDRDAAARHFEDALAMNRRMGARPHVAATLHDYANELVRRTPSVDERTRAVAMCREALDIARELGMPGLEVLCNQLLAAHAPQLGSGDSTRRPHDLELAPHGSFWKLSHSGREVVIKDRKGIRYIAELLRNPDRDVHTRDLVAMLAPATGRAAPAFASSSARRQHAEAHAGDFSENLVDPKARRAYERRLAELEDEIGAAAGSGDPEEIAVLREERDALEREMARITGLGGRTRRIDDGERARVAVTRAIRGALAEVASMAPDVGGVLARRIRTGTYCRYSPDTGALDPIATESS